MQYFNKNSVIESIMDKMDNRIDFVILWVDGSDPVWTEEKRKYERLERVDSHTNVDTNSECRYRDNGWLRYWFRGVEKFAPWVNQIHFVTCGQKPEWLNVEHPKLHLVDHKDYIPHQWLPTYNSVTLEMNLHRIKELSEQFVYFNDDMFLLQPVNPSFFFRQGLPVLDADLSYSRNIGYAHWCRLGFNNYCIVNRTFNIRKSVKKNWYKWFNIKELGFKRTRKNLMSHWVNRLLPMNTYGHMALPHLKSSLQDIWDCHPEVMEQATKSRFRSDDGVNQWMICAWSQAKGLFYPVHYRRLGNYFSITPESTPRICDMIKNGATPQICINDCPTNTDAENCGRLITEAFETLLPEKSEFENEKQSWE